MEPLTTTTNEKKDSSTSCNIRVYIRVRPALKNEYEKEISVEANEQVTYFSGQFESNWFFYIH